MLHRQVVVGLRAVERLLGTVVDAGDAQSGELQADRVGDLLVASGGAIARAETSFGVAVDHVVIVEHRHVIPPHLAVGAKLVVASELREEFARVAEPLDRPGEDVHGVTEIERGVEVPPEHIQVRAREPGPAGDLAKDEEVLLADALAYS